MNHAFLWVPLMAILVTILSSCSENPPAGPDLSAINERDIAFFNETYNRCNINNSTNDCNCVARVNIDHRTAAYNTYSAAYDTTHKPALEQQIKTLGATLIEKTANRSDERVLAALEDELHKLEQKLENGLNDIENFNLPFLPPGVTDNCKLAL